MSIFDVQRKADERWNGYRDILASCIYAMDNQLDARVADAYKEEPLAQDWARVAKVSEELGEAIAELIAYTGQNPRKGEPDPSAGDRMIDELCDVAMTALYGIQHFTKDTNITLMSLINRTLYHCERVGVTP